MEEIWAWPEEDGRATIRRGLVAPSGTYRCWGDGEKLDAIVARLRERWGKALLFASPAQARTAMDEADAGRLGRRLEGELAARDAAHNSLAISISFDAELVLYQRLMKRICYLSRARNTLGPTDREDILRCSVRNNEKAGITGLLVCDGFRFLQSLEGEDDDLDACWSRIKSDDRHYDAVVFEYAKIDRREFGGWALNCRSQLTIDARAFRTLVMQDVADVTDAKLKAMFIGFAALAR